MSDNEFEQVLAWLVVLDKAKARASLFVIIALSIILFGVYGYMLQIICLFDNLVLVALLLGGIQTPIGMLLTKKYFDLGSGIRNKLTLVDSSHFSRRWQTKEIEVTIGLVHRIFETMHLTVETTEEDKIDDFTDIAWFIVFLLAVLTMFTTLQVGISLVTGMSIAIVQGIISIILLFHGYRNGRVQSLAEAILDLESYVLLKTATICETCRKKTIRIFVRLKSWWRMYVLYDFVIRVFSTSPESVVFEYHFGLSKATDEKLCFTKNRCIIEKCLSNLSLVRDQKWTIINDYERLLEIVNLGLKTSLSDLKTWSFTPATIKNTLKALEKDLSILLTCY